LRFQEFAVEPNRPNLVARLKGNGQKRPLLLMGHTDTVNVDVSKWTFPPFSAARDSGYIYGRGTVDDKDNVAASLMVMLLLKQLKVQLDRDVIFLAEAGEEGTTRVGIQHMVNDHFDAIDAEYCMAEGGNGSRVAGNVRFISVRRSRRFRTRLSWSREVRRGTGPYRSKTTPSRMCPPRWPPSRNGSRRCA
jgi:acetylornithine deacetylase/succinyl-diaminopimelate desuccinylase-like protein